MVEGSDELPRWYELAYSFVPSRENVRKGYIMSELQTFFIVLLAICGGITTIGGAINLLFNWKKGSRVSQHDEKLKEHDNEFKDHETRIRTLEDKTKEQDSFIKVLCNSILALVSHEINGNSKDKLRDAQKELQDFLINK